MAEEVTNSMKNVCLSIPFSSAESAALVCEVLSVDKELKGSKVRREISVNGLDLLINFHGDELKMLRVAVNSVLKNMLLIVKTINEFENS